MPWRNWSVIIVLILANYVVFSIIGALLFPVTPPIAPTLVARPTFTSAPPPLQRVGTLVYETPTPTLTSTSTATATLRITTTATITITPTPTP